MKPLAIAVVFLASAAAAAPPVARPFTETVHGITLTDEYRWMEDAAKASEMDAWVLSESTKASAAMKALPERAAFAAKLEAVSSGLTRVRGVQIAGPVTVFRRASAGDKTAKLIVHERGRERVLLDPNAASGAVLAINSVSLSPDGK